MIGSETEENAASSCDACCPCDLLSGALVLDKPQGRTSHDMVYLLRRLLGMRSVGHTGTLDPMATGLLVMLVGRATKAAEYLGAERKKYEATMLLGIKTDTQDITGKVLGESDAIPSCGEVLAVIGKFTGDIMQLPPMYSAKKVHGAKLVDLARRGIECERKPCAVTVYAIDAERISEREYRLTVDCSAGTYIRTLCADIGDALGCGAVMSQLRRVAAGSFTLAEAISADTAAAMPREALVDKIIPVDELFRDYDRVVLDDFFSRLCRSGCEIYEKKIDVTLPEGTRVRIYDRDGFFALGEVRAYPDGLAVKAIKIFRL